MLVQLFYYSEYLFLDPKYFKKDFFINWKWLKKKKGASDDIEWTCACCCTRFFLGLDQFLPANPLGLANNGDFSKIGCVRFIFYNMYKISGWVLIPLILTAVYITRQSNKH